MSRMALPSDASHDGTSSREVGSARVRKFDSPSGGIPVSNSTQICFGVTEEPFIVFAANAFALLGLRALYFLVTGLLDRLVYLSTGLSVILAFIGVKLLLHFGHLQDDSIPEVKTSTSLAVIVVILAVTVAASLVRARRDPDARAHAGSLRDHPERPDGPG